MDTSFNRLSKNYAKLFFFFLERNFHTSIFHPPHNYITIFLFKIKFNYLKIRNYGKISKVLTVQIEIVKAIENFISKIKRKRGRISRNLCNLNKMFKKKLLKKLFEIYLLSYFLNLL